jgi:hypothetical protein
VTGNHEDHEGTKVTKEDHEDPEIVKLRDLRAFVNFVVIRYRRFGERGPHACIAEHDAQRRPSASA